MKRLSERFYKQRNHSLLDCAKKTVRRRLDSHMRWFGYLEIRDLKVWGYQAFWIFNGEEIGRMGVHATSQNIELSSVNISVEYQNSGHGTRWITSVLNYFRKLGFTKAWLKVGDKNLRAQHVYGKCGFVKIGYGGWGSNMIMEVCL